MIFASAISNHILRYDAEHIVFTHTIRGEGVVESSLSDPTLAVNQ